MVLMLPPVRSGFLSAPNNFAASPAGASNRGTNVVAAGSANTKGSWTQIIASAPFEVFGIAVQVTNNSSAGGERHGLWDIGIGAASSEQVIASNIGFGAATVNIPTQPTPQEIFLPIRIPKGSRIAMRAQNSTASQTSNVLMTLYGGYTEPPWRVFAGADCIGADTATSKLTALTAPSGVGTESSWTSIGSTTTRPYQAAKLIVATDTQTVMTNISYHAEWGWNSTTLAELWLQGTTNETVGSFFPTMPEYAWIPTGTQLQARYEGSASTTDPFEFGILCFY